jgi:hypothetical protein
MSSIFAYRMRQALRVEPDALADAGLGGGGATVRPAGTAIVLDEDNLRYAQLTSGSTVALTVSGTKLYAEASMLVNAPGLTVSGADKWTTSFDFDTTKTNRLDFWRDELGNHYSSSPASTASVPVINSAPTSLNNGTPGATTVALTWGLPATGDSPTDYVVQYAIGGTSFATPITFADGTSTTLGTTITGLTAASTIDVRVAGVNSAGQGAWATKTGITMAAAATVPGAVTSLANGTPGTTTLAITWGLPATGSAPTDYVGQWALSGSGFATPNTIADGTSTALNMTATGLTAGSTIDVRVAAANSAGQGPWTTLTNVAMASAVVAPNAPATIDTGTVGSTSIVVNLGAPTGGGSPTDYVYQYAAAGTSFASPTTVADGTSTALTTTITGLTASTAYDLRAAASNSAGQSGWVTKLNVTTTAAGGGAVAPVTFAGMTNLTNEGSEVYAATSAGTSNTARGWIGSAATGDFRIEALYNGANTDNSFVLGADTIAPGDSTYGAESFLIQAGTTGGLFWGVKVGAGATTATGQTLTGSATTRVALVREAGVVAGYYTTDDWATRTLIKQFSTGSVATLSGRVYTAFSTTARRVRQPRVSGFGA